MKQTDPFFDWFSATMDPVPNNCDDFVSLEWSEDLGRYVWTAVDAQDRVLVTWLSNLENPEGFDFALVLSQEFESRKKGSKP